MARLDEEVLALPPLSLSDGVRPLVFPVTDLLRPTPYRLEEGKEAHAEQARRLFRGQKLRGIPEGEYRFEVGWVTERWGLSGKVDLVVVREEEVIPVDFKDSRNLEAAHFRLQLGAYALLMEERFGRPAVRGFLYSIPRRLAFEVRITPPLRRKVVETVQEMARWVQGEAMPEGPKSRAPCVACEFRRYCNDRL